MKKFKTLYYIIFVFSLGLGALVYFTLNQTAKTVPRITLSYFKDTQEVAGAIGLRLQQELLDEKHIWLGVEPEKPLFLNVVESIKQNFEKNHGVFDKIFIDSELGIKPDQLSFYNQAEVVQVKMDWPTLSQKIQTLKDQKVLVVTAAIYSTNLLKQNPIDKLKSVVGVQPTTFSMGYFSINSQDEKNNLFPCDTEDKEGIKDWGCAVLNKARSQRRKVNLKKIDEQQLLVGVMDLTGQKDYMLLLR